MPDRQKILKNSCQKLVKSNEIKQFHEKDRGNTNQEEKRKKKTDPMICVNSRVFGPKLFLTFLGQIIRKFIRKFKRFKL